MPRTPGGAKAAADALVAAGATRVDTAALYAEGERQLAALVPALTDEDIAALKAL